MRPRSRSFSCSSGGQVQGRGLPGLLLSSTVPSPRAVRPAVWITAPTTIRQQLQPAYRICVDGGCNRLFDQLPDMIPYQDPAASRAAVIPDLILGDLDSLRPEVCEFYQNIGVPVHDLSADQLTTDMHKSVAEVETIIKQRPADERHQVVVLGAIGGRLDHLLSNLNTLYTFPHLNIALWGEGNLVRLVRSGRALIQPDRRFEGPACGLVPFGSAAIATSTGLVWNLTNTLMAVGGLISTSNTMDADSVCVQSDTPLLWMVELHEERLLQGQVQTPQENVESVEASDKVTCR